MTGKYIVLYSLPSPAGVSGTPVVISKGELLMDRISEKLFARISMQSLDEREVHAVTLRIQLFDEVGAPIDIIVDFRYNSLKAERDDEFGWNQLIPILNKNTRSFSTYINNVTFSDFSYWENNLPFHGFGRLQTLEEALGNKLLAKQFEAQYGSDCHYMPVDETVIWYCACGAINRSDEDRCHICRRKMTALKDVNYEALKMEAKTHEDIDKKEESNEEDNKKTKKEFIDLKMFFF